MQLDGYEKGGADAWKTFAKGDIKFKIETAEGEAKDAKRKVCTILIFIKIIYYKDTFTQIFINVLLSIYSLYNMLCH